MTPNYGLPFPVLGDSPNGPAAFQALAEAVDAALFQVESDGESRWGNIWFDQALTGTVSDSVINGPKTYGVTFSKQFAAAPVVLLTWFEGQYGWAYLSSASGSDMVVGVRPEAGGSTIPRVRWVALGRSA